MDRAAVDGQCDQVVEQPSPPPPPPGSPPTLYFVIRPVGQWGVIVVHRDVLPGGRHAVVRLLPEVQSPRRWRLAASVSDQIQAREDQKIISVSFINILDLDNTQVLGSVILIK